jgi:hypothetical protein
MGNCQRPKQCPSPIPSLPESKGPWPDDTPEEEMHTMADGHITFTRKFKHLGSWLTQDLRINADIAIQIWKATAQVHGLVNIWRSKHVAMQFKKLLCLQLPLNTVLWGAESWTQTAKSKRKVQRFHHAAIRNIMNITMFEVEEKRITNQKLRESFDNIRNITEFIEERQLTWLAQVLKMDPKQSTRKLANAWITHPRQSGQPQHNLRHSHLKALIAIGEIDMIRSTDTKPNPKRTSYIQSTDL